MSKFTKVGSIEEATRVDVASSTTTYLGKAIPGTLPSSPTWQVVRLTLDPSGSLIKEYAGGSSYNQIWDNRASLTYI